MAGQEREADSSAALRNDNKEGTATATADSSSALRNDNREPVRGTQSIVHTLSVCWRRPGLTLREVVWRWAYGVPALWLVWTQGKRVWGAATGGTMDPAAIGLDKALLNDPVGALTANTLGVSAKIGTAVTQLAAQAFPAAYWVVAVLLVGWVVVSALGRNWVAREADPAMKSRIGTLMVLQALRTGILFAILLFWFSGLTAAANALVSHPLANGGEPNLVGFAAVTIVLSLALFTAWAAVSWVLSVAPLLAMLRGLGAAASLRAAFRLGPLRGKLVEINLVLGIVKIALVVLAMVFSATPLPFQAVTSAGFLAWWWAGVTLLYLLWSDYFHVVRLMAYIRLWRTFTESAI